MAIDARGYTYSDLTSGRVSYDLLTEELTPFESISSGDVPDVDIPDGYLIDGGEIILD